jgi:hypothetical protein
LTTSESLISASIVLAITLPTRAALTATEPDAATLTIAARILPERSMGEPSRLLLSSAALFAGTIQSGIRLGAMSLARSVTSPAAVTMDPPLIAAFTVLATALPSAETCTAVEPEPATPMARARMMAEDSEVSESVEPVSSVEP